jgi:hypothetical protein
MPTGCSLLQRWRLEEIYSGLVLDLSSLDLEEIGNALSDQTDYEHRWLINPQTGQIAFWTADTGIDGQRRPMERVIGRCACRDVRSSGVSDPVQDSCVD